MAEEEAEKEINEGGKVPASEPAEKKVFNLHLVSDSTGETLNHMARACIAQFEGMEAEKHYWSLIRNEPQMDIVLRGIEQNPGLVLFTVIHDDLRRKLVDHCRRLQLPCVGALEPVLTALSGYLGRAAAHKAGRQHALDTDYYARIEAMEFALACDDGQGADKLYRSEVIVVGVSRTSKTPTCLYLANRGIFAANIPVVKGVELPGILKELSTPLVVGLTREPGSLIDIRRNRLHFLHETRDTEYISPDEVEEEVKQARKYFSQAGWPVIDVTRRSIEETAAEIMILMNRKKAGKAAGHGPKQ